MNCTEAANLVPAYVDGELDIAASLEVEKHVAQCPACKQKVENERRWKSALTGKIPTHNVPAGLLGKIRTSIREEAAPAAPKPKWWISLPRLPILWGAFAGALAVILLTLAPWWSGGSELRREAVSDHVRSLLAAHLIDVVSSDRHTVKPWFAGKLPFSPSVIDTSASGFPLVGGRLDVLDGQTVAAIIYQRRKHYINIFIWPAKTNTLRDGAFREDGYHILTWSKSGMNYLVVSELASDELGDFAGLVRKGLE